MCVGLWNEQHINMCLKNAVMNNCLIIYRWNRKKPMKQCAEYWRKPVGCVKEWHWIFFSYQEWMHRLENEISLCAWKICDPYRGEIGGQSVWVIILSWNCLQWPAPEGHPESVVWSEDDRCMEWGDPNRCNLGGSRETFQLRPTQVCHSKFIKEGGVLGVSGQWGNNLIRLQSHFVYKQQGTATVFCQWCLQRSLP